MLNNKKIKKYILLNVNFCGYESTREKIDVAVPQVSVLRPLLFLIHNLQTILA